MKKLITLFFALLSLVSLSQQISKLPRATSIDSANLMVIVQDGVTKKIDYYLVAREQITSLLDSVQWFYDSDTLKPIRLDASSYTKIGKLLVDSLYVDGGSGDFNGNGYATGSDAYAIQVYLMNPAFPATREQLMRSDVDGDGLITMSDRAYVNATALWLVDYGDRDLWKRYIGRAEGIQMQSAPWDALDYKPVKYTYFDHYMDSLLIANDTIKYPGITPMPGGSAYGRFLMQEKGSNALHWANLQNIADSISGNLDTLTYYSPIGDTSKFYTIVDTTYNKEGNSIEFRTDDQDAFTLRRFLSAGTVDFTVFTNYGYGEKWIQRYSGAGIDFLSPSGKSVFKIDNDANIYSIRIGSVDNGVGIQGSGVSGYSLSVNGKCHFRGGVKMGLISNYGYPEDVQIYGLYDDYLLFSDSYADRIGIGTDDPNTKLHVIGDLTLEGASQAKTAYQLFYNSITGQVSWGDTTSIGAVTETDPIWSASEANYGNLSPGETILGNWINTANPWGITEIEDDLSLFDNSTSNFSDISGTPSQYQFAWFTDANTIAGCSEVTLTSGDFKYAANVTAPYIIVHNTGNVGGAGFEFIDSNSGADWKFKSTTYASFKIRDQANGVDVLEFYPSSAAHSLVIEPEKTTIETDTIYAIGDVTVTGNIIDTGNVSIIGDLQYSDMAYAVLADGYVTNTTTLQTTSKALDIKDNYNLSTTQNITVLSDSAIQVDVPGVYKITYQMMIKVSAVGMVVFIVKHNDTGGSYGCGYRRWSFAANTSTMIEISGIKAGCSANDYFELYASRPSGSATLTVESTQVIIEKISGDF